MKKGATVIVINTDNYKAAYSEPVIFKAVITEITDHPCYWVKSLVTGIKYELYDHQILECLDIEEIRKLIDLSKYGS
jgi:hypothetical protein